MKPSGQMQRWGVGVLGAVSLLLIVNLVVQYNRFQSGIKPHAVKTRPLAKAGAPVGARTAVGKQPARPKAPDDLSIYDSIVKLDLMKEYEDRPLPESHRDPFEFVEVHAPVRVQTVGAAPAPVQAPPPPPLNLKVMGYTEGKGAPDEAMVELCAASCENSSPDDQVLVVHAGEPVGSRYKVIKITPTVVTVEDAAIHQTVDLPVPQ